jgi:hypothetical protein
MKISKGRMRWFEQPAVHRRQYKSGRKPVEILEGCARVYDDLCAGEVKLTWEVAEASSYGEGLIQDGAQNVHDYAV